MMMVRSRMRLVAALVVLAACSDENPAASRVRAPAGPAALALTVDGTFALGGVEAIGINNAGQMAGSSYEADRAHHAVRWTAAGVKQVLQPLSGDTNQIGLTHPGS